MIALGPAATRTRRISRGLRVLGMGLALPGQAITTEGLIDRVEGGFGVRLRPRADTLARLLDIRTRHLCRDLARPLEAPRPGDGNADLAARAVRTALDDARLAPRDLGYLIGHTATPDTLLPPGVAAAADRLGYAGPFAEFRQACTGFANALMMAHALLADGDAPVAIVGSEIGSVFFDPRRAAADRSQLVNMLQMGDAAACIVLGQDTGDGDVLDNLAFGCMGLDVPPGLSLRGGGASCPAPNGISEFAHDYAAIRRNGPMLFQAGAAAARSFGVVLSDVRAVIPHQVNGRLDELLAGPLGIPPAHVVTMARRVGNTGSAAIWAALAELRPTLASGDTAIALGAEATKHMFATFRFRKG